MPPSTNPNPLAPGSGQQTGHLDLGDLADISIPTQAGTDYELVFAALPDPSNPSALNPVLTIDPAPANPLTATGGPFEGTGAPHQLTVEEASGRPFDYEIEVRPLVAAYLVLYDGKNYNGLSLRIGLEDGGRVNVSGAMADEATSVELFAPANVEVELVEHAVGYYKYPGAKRRWRGNGGCLRISKKELKQAGLNNEISSISWFVNGQLANNTVGQRSS